ncbi:MAG TPA: ABC transporter ATP-binding protein, partial [Planctomycetota bacterium]|nr:ABC transporter ATP-binding protein [Planctomycetota bacterium]
MSAPSIRLEDVSKWYGDVLAANEVTAEFGPGVTGLLGPNGAGKSTLLKLVTGTLAPSLGTVRLCGEPPFSSPHVLRRLGVVPEQDPVYPRASALEVTTYLTRLHGFSARDAKARARAALERVGLADAMHRRVGNYSKGMRQRAKLAQALAHGPDILFLDEPLTGCDPLARVRVLEVLKAFAAADPARAIVVSSHVLHEIETLTSTILLIHKGQVLAEGDVYAIRALIDKHPHKVRVECDRPRELGRAL